jgi:hypothetical protein
MSRKRTRPVLAGFMAISGVVLTVVGVTHGPAMAVFDRSSGTVVIHARQPSWPLVFVGVALCAAAFLEFRSAQRR